MATNRIQCWCIDEKEDKKYDIISASYKGHVDCVKRLIDEGCDLEVTERLAGFFSTGALRAAASHGHTRVMKILLEAGINVNGTVTDINTGGVLMGASPLVTACMNGDTETIKILLDAKADPNPEINSEFNEPPLCAVALMNKLEGVKLLVDAGASLDFRFYGSYDWIHDVGGSALCKAASHGYDTIVEYLIAVGADLNIRSLRGKTALMEAATYNDSGCRSVEGKVKCAQLLIKAGSDIHAKSAHGMSALEYAAINNDRIIMEMLLVENAHINEYEECHDSQANYSCEICCPFSNVNIKKCRDEHMLIIKHTTTESKSYELWEVDIPCINLAYAAGAECPKAVIEELKNDAVQIHHWDDETLESVLMLKDDRMVASLRDICRDAIREHLMALSKAGASCKNLFIAVPRLPLPEIIRDFLLFDMKPQSLQSAWDPLPNPLPSCNFGF